MIVAHTIRMSAHASGTLRSPAKNRMNSRLATMLMANGTPTFPPTLPRSDGTKTNPKLTTMIGQRIVQIRLIVDGAGVHDGFTSELDHSIQVMLEHLPVPAP